MNELLTEMVDILEVDAVKPEDKLRDFDSWDSLSALSVIAMAESRFGVNIAAQELKSVETVQSLYDLIQSKKS